MNKLVAFILILIIAALLGGIYGIIHDQITYTISEEYYTKFKFYQFGLATNGDEFIPDTPRFYVSIVGILATWWVGLIAGVILGLVGLVHRNGKTMFYITMKAIGLTIVIALLVGLIGLFYGKLFLVDIPPNWFFPDNLINKDQFILVGSMHNFSYLGGFVGLIVAAVFSIRQKRKYKKTML